MMDGWLLIKRDLYWRPNGEGYTGIRDHAGRYSFEEAQKWVGNGKSGVSMIRASEAPLFSKACFDDLARDHLAKQRDEAASEIARLRAALQRVVEEGQEYVDGIRGPTRDTRCAEIAREALNVSGAND